MQFLLVEDDPVDRKLVRRLLQEAGLRGRVVEASTLAEARRALEELEQLDGLLLDIHLPDGDGRSLLEWLQEQGGPPAPVIVLTSRDEHEGASRCLQMGAQDFLVKGHFDADDLARAVRHARERFRLTAELSDRNGRLLRSNQELERFAGVASHDLQEPLRSVRGMAELLLARHGERLPADGQELVQRIVDGAQRMRELIDDLLELSRITREEPPAERVELPALLGAVREELAGALRESGAELLLPERAPAVRGEAGQLTRLFVNLIGNALKFRAPGREPRVRVTARAVRRGEPDGAHIRAAGARVELSVVDNGIGFAPEQAEEIFQPFRRLQPRTRYPGTGIGLAIARAIVEHHGGRIRAVGRPGEGAEVWLTLPAADGPGSNL